MLSPSEDQGRPIVFFDFDNTITPFDVLDDILDRFSIDARWKMHEKAWEAGKIGSRECLEAQLSSVRVSEPMLFKYLSTVPIDPHFRRLVKWLKKRDVASIIVSDSFSLFIQYILKHNKVDDIPVYANEIRLEADRLIPSFPYASKDCARCAHCKKKHILEHKDRFVVYIGDGRSDICPAEHSHLVFAKGALLEHFQKSKRPCVEFNALADVSASLKTKRNEGGELAIRTGSAEDLLSGPLPAPSV